MLLTLNRLLIMLVVILFVCQAQAVANQDEEYLATLARSVTIYRDTYGVPHVFGRTDEALRKTSFARLVARLSCPAKELSKRIDRPTHWRSRG
jgi:hypothetical protein